MSADPRAAVTAALPTIAAALLPKCPLCLVAIASSVGLELPLLAPALLPLMVILLAISLTLIFRASRRCGHFGGSVLASVAVPLLIAQRVFAMPAFVAHGSVLLLVAAAIWTALPAAGGSRCLRG